MVSWSHASHAPCPKIAISAPKHRPVQTPRFRRYFRPSPVIRGPKIPLIRPCLALCLWERPVLASFALPGSRYGPRNPRITVFSNARRPRPGHTPRKFLCRLKSPASPTNYQNKPLKSRVCGRLSWLGTWDAQTERPCLSTRGPRKPVLIWPSMATAAAIGRIADAQPARAETCTRTRPRSCTKRPSGAIAMTPTNHPERRLRAVYMCERGAVRARAPVISEKIVG